MKNILTLCMLLLSITSYPQVFFYGEDRYSIDITTDNVIFQNGTAYVGLEFLAEFSNGIYIRPQIHFADLEDGYLETSVRIMILNKQ